MSAFNSFLVLNNSHVHISTDCFVSFQKLWNSLPNPSCSKQIITQLENAGLSVFSSVLFPNHKKVSTTAGHGIIESIGGERRAKSRVKWKLCFLFQSKFPHQHDRKAQYTENSLQLTNSRGSPSSFGHSSAEVEPRKSWEIIFSLVICFVVG